MDRFDLDADSLYYAGYMDNPLDDALSNLDQQEAFRRQQRELETRKKYLARELVVQGIRDFLQRMNSSSNPATYKIKQGFLRPETVWHVGWITSESRKGFLLTPDGRIDSSGYEMENGWCSYGMAQFFGIDGRQAEVIESNPRPSAQLPMQDLDMLYMPEAEAIVKSLATILQSNVPH
jgi:hypothetical protein